MDLKTESAPEGSPICMDTHFLEWEAGQHPQSYIGKALTGIQAGCHISHSPHNLAVLLSALGHIAAFQIKHVGLNMRQILEECQGSFIQNRPQMETSQVSINKKMDKHVEDIHLGMKKKMNGYTQSHE